MAELDRASHIVVVAPALFSSNRSAVTESAFLSSDALGLLNKLCGWLAAGNTLEIALPVTPAISSDYPASLEVASKLSPWATDGVLKLWRVPKGFDLRAWPRVTTNPGKLDSCCYFSSSLSGASFLDLPLDEPAWKGPGLTATDLASLRPSWELLDAKVFVKMAGNMTLTDYRVGERRNPERDFEFCRQQRFGRVRIEDPFVLGNSASFQNLKALVAVWANLWSAWPTTFELKTRDNGLLEQKKMLEDLKRWVEGNGTTFAGRLLPGSGLGRKDFHDRRITFMLDPAKPQKRTTALLTGGIDRYMEAKFECSIVVHRG